MQCTSSLNLPKRNCSLETNLLNPKHQENTCYLRETHNFSQLPLLLQLFCCYCCLFSQTGSHASQAGLDITTSENELDIFIFLWSPLKCWDYMRAPPFQASYSYLLMLKTFSGLTSLDQKNLKTSSPNSTVLDSTLTSRQQNNKQPWADSTVLFTLFTLSSSQAGRLESVNKEKGL